MNRILVPSDFSSEAEDAILFAMSLAQTSASEIIVLYVVDLPTIAGPIATLSQMDPTYVETLRQAAMQKFNTFIGQQRFYFKPIKLVIETGSVTQVILRFAATHNVASIVMGTKGATGLKEIFVGSNTEKVVRLSPVPVFTVPTATDVKDIKTIVFPTSLDLNNTPFMNRLKDLQKALNAHLHLLYINTRGSFMNAEDVEEFITFYELQDVSYTLRNAVTEQSGILDFVNAKQTDLLAMATHGRRGLSHLYSGSITEDVVNHIHCPVWTSTIAKTDNEQLAQREKDAMTARRKRHEADV